MQTPQVKVYVYYNVQKQNITKVMLVHFYIYTYIYINIYIYILKTKFVCSLCIVLSCICHLFFCCISCCIVDLFHRFILFTPVTHKLVRDYNWTPDIEGETGFVVCLSNYVTMQLYGLETWNSLHGKATIRSHHNFGRKSGLGCNMTLLIQDNEISVQPLLIRMSLVCFCSKCANFRC